MGFKKGIKREITASPTLNDESVREYFEIYVQYLKGEVTQDWVIL